MPSIRPEDLTPFGRLALRLDLEFAELSAIEEQLTRANIETDGGLDEGVKILGRAALCGQAIAEAMQGFSESLQEARDKAEAATKAIAERAQLIAGRRQEQERLRERLERLREDVKAAGAGVTASDKPAGELTEEDRRRMASELERLQAPMGRFVEAAKALKAEAAGANFKRLERQADSMIDSLGASLRKIAQAIAPK